MKLIKLTRGKYAKVDDEDFEYLNQFRWHIHKMHKHLYFAERVIRWYLNKKGKHEKISRGIHREIMGCTEGDKKWIYHINGDCLDNQQKNLVVCTRKKIRKALC